MRKNKKMKIPTLSYTIAYNGEITAITNTFMQNVCNNRLYAGSIEFVMVDFSGKKDLQEWLIKNCNEALQSGYLKYYKANEPDSWHEAIANNKAAFHASNEIIVSIDSGFIVDMECTAFIIKTFLENKNTIVHIHTQQEKWHPGHLAISREDFVLAGGYDESLEATGYHSTDLQNRLEHIGLKTVSYFQTDADYSPVKQAATLTGYTYGEYNRMLHQNQITSIQNIAQGRLIANEASGNESTPLSGNELQVSNQVSICQNNLIEQLSQQILLSDHADLLNGQSGVALLLYHYSRQNPQNKMVQCVADKLLDLVIKKLSKESEYETVSIITSICYLMKDGFVEPDTSIFKQVDNWLFDAENKPDSHADLSKKTIAGLYMYHRIQFSKTEESIIWKERMKDFFETLYILLSTEIYLFRFPVFNCLDLSVILYLCSKFEKDDYFQSEIDLIYKDLIPVIEISIREAEYHADPYLLSWIVKDTTLGSQYVPVVNTWETVSITDINHFFLYRYLLDVQIEIPEPIERLLISRIQSPKHIDRLLSLLMPATCGLSHYIAGFAWALLQWSAESELKKHVL